MTAWLTDTLIYTGVLIALVLALRGPVARNFGPQMAYALWALPLVRFIMPPIVLPSSLAPEAAAPAADWTTVDVAPVVVDAPAPEAVISDLPPADAIAPLPDFAPMAPEPGWWFDTGVLLEAAIVLWLAGAVAFLAWRTWTYLRMRGELLAGSRPVGEAGKIRLVETPAVDAPVAFGVSDKVIALPMQFMAWHDRQARDLAIEHELAHHRGGDLLANMLAQPVLALHWFNPLAWAGWRAMRRDQEAACDARVIAWCGPHERAFYGEVIASFAAGPRLGLAAPMACPMVNLTRGEKSIIHRLRSLNMSEISPRRRFAGRTLLAGAALALPLTASISYAEAQVPPPWPDAPDAADTPDAPDAPDFHWRDDADIDVEVRHVDGKRIVTVTKEIEGEDGEADRTVVRSFVIAPHAPQAPMGPRAARAPQAPQIQFRHARGQMSEEEWERQVEQWEAQSEHYQEQWEKWGEEFGEQFGEEWTKRMENMPAVQPFPQGFTAEFDFDCDEDGTPLKVERSARNERAQRFVLCNPMIANANARAAIERARASVARDRNLSEDVREEVLESLDREIERLSGDS